MNDPGRAMRKTNVVPIANFARAAANLTGLAASLSLAIVASADVPVTQPEYALHLNTVEYSFLTSAAMRGVDRYGGDATFDSHITRRGSEIEWDLTIRGDRLLDVWSYWLSELGAELLDTAKLDPMPADQQAAVMGFRSIRKKLVAAKSAPYWPLTYLRGQVEVLDGSTTLSTASGRVALSGRTADQFAPLAGQSVLCAGIVRRPNELEIRHIEPVRDSQIDLVVMSLCPFARRAEHNLFDQMDSSGSTAAPPVRFHFLFYRNTANGSLTSLHGEPEIAENLVQMTLRDLMPEHLVPYLRIRAERDEPWEQIAAVAGLDPGEIEVVRSYYIANRESMMRAEFERVSELLGVTDGSPTVFWNGDRVRSIGAIPIFTKVIANDEGACHDTQAIVR